MKTTQVGAYQGARVPHYVLYRRPGGSHKLHANPACQDALMDTVSFQEIVDETVTAAGENYVEDDLHLCDARECLVVMGKDMDDLDLFYRAALAHHALSILHALGTKEAMAVEVHHQRGTWVQDRGPWGGVNSLGDDAKALYETIVTEIQELTVEHLQRMRTPRWQEGLLDELSKHTTAHDALVEARMDWERPGILVGPRDPDREGGYVGGLLEVLAPAEDGTNVLVKGPLGALVQLLDNVHYLGGDGVLGIMLQVVPEPEDLTPEMEETIKGIFTPGSDSVLSELPEAIKTARRLLQK